MLVYIAIYASILYFIRKYYGYRIKKAEGIDEAILLRKRMLQVAQFVMILCVVIWSAEALIEMYLFHFREGELNIFSLLSSYVLIVGCAVFFYLYLRKKYNVSFAVYKKEEFLTAHPRFVLYLRAFSSDNYKAKTNESMSWSTFSEDEFVRSLRGILPVCAIGMTKEIVAPRGAMRVYVSDLTWQTDVRELMERAESIVILLDDRPSCLWEIEQSSDLLDKTSFIVVDREKYESVRVKLASKIGFPTVSDVVPLPFCVYNLNDSVDEDNLTNRLKVFHLENSLKGYDVAWDYLLEAGLNKQRKGKRREGTVLRWARMLLSCCTICALFIILTVLLIFAIINIVQGEILKSAIDIIVIILLLSYFFWDDIKKRLRIK